MPMMAAVEGQLMPLTLVLCGSATFFPTVDFEVQGGRDW